MALVGYLPGRRGSVTTASMLKFYGYAKCSTCRTAKKHLDAKKAEYTEVSIVEEPPSPTELKRMLGYLKAAGKSFKNLFNTSGEQYRELQISEKIKAGMTEAEALKLLATHGKLIKRPFIVTPKGGTVGYDPEVINALLRMS